MSTHAPFSPSAAERWTTCTGSFALGLQVPNGIGDSAYAAEGTRLHDVAAEWLGRADGDSRISETDYAAVLPYLDYAMGRMGEATRFAIEEKLPYSDLLFGTPDLLLTFGDVRRPSMLEVVDLKTGAGVMVDPEENAQLMTYAYMAITNERRINGRFVLPRDIRLTIVQPPADVPVKSWDTTVDVILAWGARVEDAIREAITGNGKLVVGDHCRWCKAKGTCPKIRGEVVNALAAQPMTMSVDMLGQWLDKVDLLEQFINGVREIGHRVAAEAQAQGLRGVPGWGLKPKRATRSWADEDAVLEIARRRKIKIWQDKLMSPAMAEKAHPNMPEELTKQIVAVSSGVNLVKLKPGEGPAVEVTKPEATTKMSNLMANFALMNLRK